MNTKHCVPCEGTEKPLTHEDAESKMNDIGTWTLIDDIKIEKTLKFKDFAEALAFVNKVGALAESEGHHPDLHIFNYKFVTITLSTHAIKGLSDNDFILAEKIDEMLR